METIQKASATPTKAFFVEMLVKDVTLDSAILDLLDNCVDGAKMIRGEGPYDGLEVEVIVNANEFQIKDNCGGIDLETAKNYAFKFGTDPSVQRPDKALGVFGVGMKRAIFKIGRDIHIRSASEDHTFTIQENIPEWQRRDDPEGWYFPMVVEEHSAKLALGARGTDIRITGLYDSVSQQFGSDFFGGELRRSIAVKHQHHLARGLSVKINGLSIPGTTIKFAFLRDSQLVPAFEQRPLDGVAMQLYAGVGELNGRQAGWYVYCNGRMILEHDQTEVTGWGESVDIGIPKFHNQFARFRGCVYFDSHDSTKLPWNTTKDGIDAGTEVYRTAKVRMVSHMRTVIDFLNSLDRELDEPDESKRVLFNLLAQAEYGSPMEIPNASKFTYRLPSATKPPQDNTRITFYRPRPEVEHLKSCLGVGTNKAAVETIFDWYMENMCPDAE